jgi:hypothetical protein
MIDMEGTTIGHYFRAPLRSIHKCTKLLNEIRIVKIRAIHVFNTPKFVNLILGEFFISSPSILRFLPVCANFSGFEAVAQNEHVRAYPLSSEKHEHGRVLRGVHPKKLHA